MGRERIQLWLQNSQVAAIPAIDHPVQHPVLPNAVCAFEYRTNAAHERRHRPELSQKRREDVSDWPVGVL